MLVVKSQKIAQARSMELVWLLSDTARTDGFRAHQRSTAVGLIPPWLWLTHHTALWIANLRDRNFSCHAQCNENHTSLERSALRCDHIPSVICRGHITRSSSDSSLGTHFALSTQACSLVFSACAIRSSTPALYPPAWFVTRRGRPM